MTFEPQTSTGTFVAWGKNNARENSFVVEEKKSITGLVADKKLSEKYGVILEIKSKDFEEPVIIPGTTILNKELGYLREVDKDGKVKWVENPSMYVVKKGDVIRITFKGMIPVKGGKEAYNLGVEVDR